MQIEGKDDDQNGTKNSEIFYKIISQEPDHMFCIDEKTGKVYVKENTLDREVRHRTHSTCAAVIFVHTNSKSFIRLFFNLNCMTYMALQAECNDLEVISHNDRIQNTFAQSFSLMGSKHHSLFCLNVLSFSHHLNYSSTQTLQ